MIILPIVTADANYQYLEALYGLNGKQGKEMARRIIANCNQRSMDCRQRQSVVAIVSITADAGSIIRSIASFTGAGDRVPVHPAAVTD
jgi:hypothetical protein